jgi:general secretion pathway protein F
VILFHLTPALYATLPETGDVDGTIRVLESVRRFATEKTLALVGAVVLVGVVTIVLRERALHFVQKLIPPLRMLDKDTTWFRVTSLLAILLESGEQLDRALDIVANQISGDEAKELLKNAARHLRQGGAAAAAFSTGHSVPDLFIQLYRLGETTNTLPEMMRLAAERFEVRRAERLKRLVGLVTPIATVIVGAIIGGLVYVLISAVLEVSQIAV